MQYNNTSAKKKKSSGFSTAYGNSGYVSGKKVDGSWFQPTGTIIKQPKKAQSQSSAASAAAARLAAQAAEQAAAEEARRAAAIQLESSLSALKSAYENRKSSLKTNHDTALSQLEQKQTLSAQSIGETIDRSLQQAYISHMKAQRELPLNLSLAGITGGMAESTAARLTNQYGAARNDLELSRAQQLAASVRELDAQRAKLLTSYQDALAAEERERAKEENALRSQYTKYL